MVPPHPNHLLAILGLLVSSAFLTTANAETIKFDKKSYRFDEAINIEFNYPNNYEPKNRDWVGVFNDDKIPKSVPLTTYPDDHYLSLYLRICNQQEAPCPNSVPSTGTLKFYVTDPSAEYEEAWPIQPGIYRACLIDDGASDNVSSGNYQVVGSCKKFKVKRTKFKKMVLKSEVKVLKTSYNFEETISALFQNENKITNAWVGIYDYDETLEIGNPAVKDRLLWVYTGCNNVSGNQKTSNNCGKKTKYGRVDFREDNTKHTKAGPVSWPLPKGKYIMAISFDNITPYRNIKIDRTAFDIV
mmetsp:Transcript_53799/g.60102  ORF Transcript_53799/g.60102 Transcript_53799/m.60102 type:complete len:300 (+) Transcript_53799:88-987(+)|eukprot:CAMPEP_0170787748 /NCGR_PEP_ID=MMETSP0733-20121128/18469_1 /TAXON_ID=186038 /ORGANISM="Fragilariopsis kerguelensis, Strain L26-C5" /LENGTH=299 /DNA_ID=CAMNT_0011134017 /DNA_START=68 /DNA_END=967 /DNA_ORIENTATION=+